MIMKGHKILLLLAAAGTLFLAGCQKTGVLGTGTGDGTIRFSASAAPGTKTVYGAYNNENASAATWQSLDWVNDDQVRIYSDAAVRRVGYEQGKTGQDLYYWADYKVTGAQAGSANTEAGWSSATLENLNNDGNGLGNGLMWPAGTTSAKFYAIYPAPVVAEGQTEEGTGTTLAGTKGTLAGTIPAEQAPKDDGTTDMSYAYMTAVGASAQPASDDKTNIKLNFYPAFTAFEFSLKSDVADPVTVTKFELLAAADAPALTGAFTVTYSGTTETAKTIACTGTGKTVTFTFPANTTVSSTKDLNFTLFALPQDLTGLTLRFTILEGTEEVTRSLKLTYAKEMTVDGKTYAKGEYVTFAGCNKHRINGLVMPKNIFNFKYINLTGTPMEWTAVTVPADNKDYPEATQFAVEGVNNGRYYTAADLTEPDKAEPGDKKFRQYWLLDTNHPATVKFKVMSPIGYDWLVVPEGDTGAFEIKSNLTAEDVGDSEVYKAGGLRGPIKTVDGVATTTNVILYISAKEDQTGVKALHFKTYAISRDDKIQYSLDTETQLYDFRGYHYFILNWNNAEIAE